MMTKFKIPSNLAVSETGFLFAPTTGETFTLNEIASKIFHKLQNREPLETISEYLLDEYEVDKSILERDLSDFIGMLKQNHLIEES